MSSEVRTLVLEELIELRLAICVAIEDLSEVMAGTSDPVEFKLLHTRLLVMRTARRKLELLRTSRETAPSKNRGRPGVKPAPQETLVSNYNSLTAETETSV